MGVDWPTETYRVLARGTVEIQPEPGDNKTPRNACEIICRSFDTKKGKGPGQDVPVAQFNRASLGGETKWNLMDSIAL